MALTRERLRQFHDDRVRPVRLAAELEIPDPRWSPCQAWAMEPGVVSPAWLLRLSLAWVVVFTGAVLVEPA
ncbi:MAG: hypothetical protein ABIW46_07005, partial [Acidimicrobiales bacterium]